ncbi:MAG: metal-dependent hydrolase [Actinomycetota bacterium]|nr:metal-dependent hydrolase [Actinomycetota bacterium]
MRPSEPDVAAWGALGATLPDLPAIAGAVWLRARRRWVTRHEFRKEVCEKGPFGGPDAALHSALPVAATLVLYQVSGAKERCPRTALPAFLMGWAGHALADALTHAEDARPILWPLSRWRFRSPISYWDRSRHARAFASAEHGMLLLIAARTIWGKPRALQSIRERSSAPDKT